jgi:hypothetical protein
LDDKETISLSKAREVVAYHKKHGRYPPRTTSLGNWLSHKRSAARGKGSNILYESVRNLLDTECPGWCELIDKEKISLSKAREVVAYYKKHGRYPSDNTPLGKWLSHIRSAARGKKANGMKLYESVRVLLDSECPGWF